MDEADAAQKEVDNLLDMRIAAARGELKEGVAGDCDECGEWSGRLINDTCAPCRDRYARYIKLNGRSE